MTLCGEDHPMAVLSEDDVATMRILRSRGWTFYMLGWEYGVDTSTAWYAVRGLTWQCVTWPSPLSAGADEALR